MVYYLPVYTIAVRPPYTGYGAVARSFSAPLQDMFLTFSVTQDMNT